MSRVEPADGDSASWPPMREHLERHYAVTRVSPTHLHIAVDRTAKPVQVRATKVDGIGWIELRGEVVDARNMPPTPLLLRNFTLPVDGCGLDGDILVLRQLLPMSSEHDDVDDAIETLVDRIANVVGG